MKVLVYPKDSNPYQHLLYSNMPYSTDTAYLTHIFSNNFLSLLYLPFQTLFFRLIGFRVFHIHWLYTFRYKSINFITQSYLAKLFMTAYCVSYLYFIRIIGFKLIWTAHDIIPHGDYFINNKLVNSVLVSLSDKIVTHSNNSKKQLDDEYHLKNKVHDIGFGNYLDVYPNNTDKNSARKLLNIDKSKFIYGIFGKIEEYKGVEDLIESFNEINSSKSLLYIVGICPSSELKEKILESSRRNSNIVPILKFINEDEVQTFMNIVDIFVYPFRNITTSSSIILAMSYGKTVICPSIGDLSELPDNILYRYNGTKKELTNTMRKVLDNKNEIDLKNTRAYSYIKDKKWSLVADKMNLVYKSIKL